MERLGAIKLMNELVAEFVNPETGEVVTTSLAEYACDVLNGYKNGDIPDKFFEWAYEVAERYEIKTGVTKGRPSQ